jgi:lipopolysaccharide heptosyltransferase II
MPIDWSKIRRVLVVRLRSIGDTVLCTPSLISLRRFLPDARIDILLEDWVAPLLNGFEEVDNVIPVGKSTSSRLRVAKDIHRIKYDVVFNLHGGTTGTFLVWASRGKHRIGFDYYQYKFLYTDAYPSGEAFWSRPRIHSVEQQLALLGSAGVFLPEKPATKLSVTEESRLAVRRRLGEARISGNELALMHPAAAFDTKKWPTRNFARIAESLYETGLNVIAVAAPNERQVLEELARESAVPVTIFDDLRLPEISALASMSRLFVGNDSGIAHIAAAVGTPPVVIFGSSNIDNWRPWTDGPNAIVTERFYCQPCPGYTCAEYGEPRCIQSVSVEAVINAIERVMAQKNERLTAMPTAKIST